MTRLPCYLCYVPLMLRCKAAASGTSRLTKQYYTFAGTCMRADGGVPYISAYGSSACSPSFSSASYSVIVSSATSSSPPPKPPLLRRGLMFSTVPSFPADAAAIAAAASCPGGEPSSAAAESSGKYSAVAASESPSSYAPSHWLRWEAVSEKTSSTVVPWNGCCP